MSLSSILTFRSSSCGSLALKVARLIFELFLSTLWYPFLFQIRSNQPCKYGMCELAMSIRVRKDNINENTVPIFLKMYLHNSYANYDTKIQHYFLMVF